MTATAVPHWFGVYLLVLVLAAVIGSIIERAFR